MSLSFSDAMGQGSGAGVYGNVGGSGGSHGGRGGSGYGQQSASATYGSIVYPRTTGSQGTKHSHNILR